MLTEAALLPKNLLNEGNQIHNFRGVPRGDAHFWLTYPLPRIRIWIRIRIKIFSWIRLWLRIRIKTMRIHSPGLNCQKIVI